jgi:hypothetical protein
MWRDSVHLHRRDAGREYWQCPSILKFLSRDSSLIVSEQHAMAFIELALDW